jgi:hypothetical protein
MSSFLVLTGIWFTEDVAEDTCKDLMFQDLLCALLVQKDQFLSH